MNLKIGGIYKIKYACHYFVIVDNIDLLYMYDIITKDFYLHPKSFSNQFINLELEQQLSFIKHETAFWYEKPQVVENVVDGYLGQIDDEILKQLKKILVSKSWYTDWK